MPDLPASRVERPRYIIGPTSDETRRRVAESRTRQGLPPTVENPEVLAGMAQFIINAHRGD